MEIRSTTKREWTGKGQWYLAIHRLSRIKCVYGTLICGASIDRENETHSGCVLLYDIVAYHNRNEMRACSKSNMIWYCVEFTFESLKCVDISFFLSSQFFLSIPIFSENPQCYFIVAVVARSSLLLSDLFWMFRLYVCVCIFFSFPINQIRTYCCVSKNIDIFVVLDLRWFRLYIQFGCRTQRKKNGEYWEREKEKIKKKQPNPLVGIFFFNTITQGGNR